MLIKFPRIYYRELSPAFREYVERKLTDKQRERLNSVFELITGFESTLALEVLSSIHFLLAQDRTLSEKELLEKIRSWNERKKALIKEEYVGLAVTHLRDHGQRLHLAKVPFLARLDYYYWVAIGLG